MNRRAFLSALAATPSTLAALTLGGRDAFAEIERRREIYPLVGGYLYALRANYPTVYRYLNAVDIGHAQLAEVLVTNHANEERTIYLLERVQWNNVRQMFLDPHNAPVWRLLGKRSRQSSKTAWRLSQAFDWTHVLHRQIYDILAGRSDGLSFAPCSRTRACCHTTCPWPTKSPRDSWRSFARSPSV